MDLQVLKPIDAVLHLIPDIELLLRPKLGQYIALPRYGAKPFLVPGNHIPGNIPVHSGLIAVFEAAGPIHRHPFAVPVYLTLTGIEIHLIDPQIVHTEGMEDIVAPLLKLTDKVPPFQRRYDEIRCRLQHVRRIFQ